MTTPAPVRLPIPNGVSLTVNMDQGGQPAACVLGFIGAGATPTGAALQACLDTAWSTLFRPLVSGSVTCTGGVLRRVDGSGFSFEIAAPATNASGTSGPTSVSAASTLIKWSSAGPGRAGKGRTFLPGLSAINVANGRSYASEQVTLAASAVTAYLGAAQWSGNETIKPAVLSYSNGAAYVITAGALATRVGIQRRRMR